MPRSRVGQILQITFGLAVFVSGWVPVILELFFAVKENREFHIVHFFIGVFFVTLGGFIMSPPLAAMISDEMYEKMAPFLDRIPGGRRRTDPPTTLPEIKP